MSMALAAPLFVVSALVTLAAAGFFADRLDHVGPRLGLPEALVGLLTALAADTPEISSALVALVSGNRKASLGVVLGSNVFNLAAMIGLSALAVGTVTIGRRALALEGAVSVLGLLATAGLVTGLVPAGAAFGLFAAVIGGYLVLRLRDEHEAVERPPERSRHEQRAPLAREHTLLLQLAMLVPAVALIVGGSIGMVHSALAIGNHWGVSETVMGVLVLAVLTSLPNAFTAVRLGLARRGEALVTEALASNAINVVGGLLVPALFVGVSRRSSTGDIDLAFLAVMTLVALAALAPGRGLGRGVGALLVALYVAFAAIQIVAT